MKTTIDSIIEEMRSRVEENIAVSPVSWVESALRLNVLASDLDNDLAEAEGKMAEKESELVEENPASKSKILARKSIDYTEYLKLKAKLKRIDEYIKIAKKRSMLQDI